MPDTDIDRTAARQRLDERLAELAARLEHIARDLDEAPSADSAERAVEREDDESLVGQGRLVEREMASIRRALDRLDQDDYGVCVRCGDDIDPARLAARPEAALCIDCARAEG